jgi:hypothetical protein
MARKGAFRIALFGFFEAIKMGLSSLVSYKMRAAFEIPA